jgi:phenylalanyl-tRNA synthetase alpha chain
VSVEQNFDSLLVPVDHVSRSRNDNYYINSSTMLRAHTSAHQRDIIKSGLNAFLVSGDVYRRDEIDSTHYPVFHQMEGVRLFTREELAAVCQEDSSSFELFGDCRGETEMRQAEHTREACRLVEFNLKETLLGIVRALFGDVESRWVPTVSKQLANAWTIPNQSMDREIDIQTNLFSRHFHLPTHPWS